MFSAIDLVSANEMFDITATTTCLLSHPGSFPPLVIVMGL
jgi:hypothetical protein